MNTRCPICSGWEFGDGSEDADWNACECADGDDMYTAEQLNARDAEMNEDAQ